eukprot:gene14283-5316_t
MLRNLGILAGYIIGTPEARQIRVDLWNYDLTYVTYLALKQDFSSIEGCWHTAAELSTIICSACLGYVPEKKAEFRKKFLPDVVESMLNISEKIQAKVIEETDGTQKKQHLQDLRVVLQSLTKLFENYKFLALQVISSKKYMQLLMTEEEQTCLIMMILTQNILRADMNCLADLSQSRLHGVIDEIVFKIFSTQHVSVASSAMRVLLLCIDLYSLLLDLLSSRRYRGLRSYLRKWKGRGFDGDLQRLTTVLEAKSAQQLEIVKLNEAAALIQSVYRGHLTRKKLSKANKAIGMFQRMYREKRKRTEQEKTQDQERHQREEIEKSRRRNEFLSSRTKQLQIIQNIPAKTVNTFLERVEFDAASKIQSRWRGFKTRKKIQPQLAEHRRIVAAVKIQKQVRKWLAKCRAKKGAFHTELFPHGLTDERRALLQNLIAKMREKYEVKSKPFDELQQLNEKMFSMLNNHVMGLRMERISHQRRKALLAQLDVDSETFLSTPKLTEVTKKDVEMLSSRSVPVAVAARRQHNEVLRKQQQPWWQSLMEENEDVDIAKLKERLKEGELTDEAEKQF